MKVLLFSNDLMPFGELPTSGGGLRCYQLMRGLESKGIEVIASMPGFTYLAKKHYPQIPPEYRELLWTFDTQDDILRRERPDAVLFASNWDHFNLKGDVGIPLIIDLHGSRLVETSMWGRPVSTERKVKVLSRADCLLAAGKRQRLYFYGWLLQAGRVCGDEHFIRYIPISLSPELPLRLEFCGSDDLLPKFVSGGGWFPWQNQSRAVFAVCEEIVRRQKGSIAIYGTPHERQGNSAREEFIFDTYQRVANLAKRSSRIGVYDYVGRNELIDIYRSSSVAVEAMEYNLERELAFTTRTIEYMWCGLPVIYNNYSELSEHIAEFDAGWLVDTAGIDSINQAVSEVFEDALLLAKKGSNAASLVASRFTWDKTILPLVDFLEHPVKAKAVEPVLGAVCGRPAYLNYQGETVDVHLGGKQCRVEQEFVIPAENIRGVELPVSLANEAARSAIGGLEISILTRGGLPVRRLKIMASDIPIKGRLNISFPLFFRPRGGSRFRLRLNLVRSGGCDSMQAFPLILDGLERAIYPFIAAPQVLDATATNDCSKKKKAEVICLGFIPDENNRLYRIELLTKRAIWLLRRGEWKRVFRATKKYAPKIVRLFGRYSSIIKAFKLAMAERGRV